jgi:Icc-related predicted phosphoesterase
MKILVLADEESKVLYDYFKPERLEDVELIIACGDLHKSYLEFFATVSHAPVLYVLGNHDQWCLKQPSPGEVYRDNERNLPGGCICIEDDIYVYKGIRIMGLGGSMQYQPGAALQYTENQMKMRILKMWWKLIRYGGVDILVTHAPAAGIHDLPDLPHRGFVCFRQLIEHFRPKLFVHGHIHANYGRFVRQDKFEDTVVVNAYNHYFIEYLFEES